MKIAPLLLLVGCFSATAAPTVHTELPLMSYCDLIADPVKYNGRLVRVRGTYMSAFEQSALTADGCDHWSWVEFTEDYRRNTAKRVRDTLESLDGPFEIVAVGKFTGIKPTRIVSGHTLHEGFGHMGGSDFLFEVIALERVRLTQRPPTRPN